MVEHDHEGGHPRGGCRGSRWRACRSTRESEPASIVCERTPAATDPMLEVPAGIRARCRFRLFRQPARARRRAMLGVVTAYSPEAWDSFFVAQAGATAALAGLLFVGVSINVKTIVASVRLVRRALEAFVLLVEAMLVAIIALVPDASRAALGGSLLVVAVGAWVVVTRGHLQVVAETRAANRDPSPRGSVPRRSCWARAPPSRSSSARGVAHRRAWRWSLLVRAGRRHRRAVRDAERVGAAHRDRAIAAAIGPPSSPSREQRRISSVRWPRGEEMRSPRRHRSFVRPTDAPAVGSACPDDREGGHDARTHRVRPRDPVVDRPRQP